MNLGLNDPWHFEHYLMQMLHCEADPKYVLDQKHWDVLIVQVPDDQAYYEEWQIDDNVVHNFVDKLKPEPTQSHIAAQDNISYYDDDDSCCNN